MMFPFDRGYEVAFGEAWDVCSGDTAVCSADMEELGIIV